MPETPEDSCPCLCHSDHPGIEHVRACCPRWDGPLGGHVGESLPHIEARARRQVAEEIAARLDEKSLAVQREAKEFAALGDVAARLLARAGALANAAVIAREIGEARPERTVHADRE